MNKNLLTITIIIFLIALIAYFLKDEFCSCNKNNNSVVARIDTIYRTIPAKLIVINRVRTKIIKTSDTVICTQPFVAAIDTIILHDTINAKFEYPANLVSLSVRRHPDTLRTETIVLSQPKITKDEWWVKPLFFAGGFFSGLLLGLIR